MALQFGIKLNPGDGLTFEFTTIVKILYLEVMSITFYARLKKNPCTDAGNST